MPSELCEIIQSFLYLGSYYDACNVKVLQEQNIIYILNVKDSYRSLPHPFELFHVPCDDYGKTNLLVEVFPKCFEFLDNARKLQKRVLIHCQSGVNRSASIVLAYLMHTHKWSLKDAFVFLRDKRPIIAPHEMYMKQLTDFELLLFGNSTRHEIPFAATQDALRKLKIVTDYKIIKGAFSTAKDILTGAAVYTLPEQEQGDSPRPPRHAGMPSSPLPLPSPRQSRQQVAQPSSPLPSSKASPKPQHRTEEGTNKTSKNSGNDRGNDQLQVQAEYDSDTTLDDEVMNEPDPVENCMQIKLVEECVLFQEFGVVRVSDKVISGSEDSSNILDNSFSDICISDDVSTSETTTKALPRTVSINTRFNCTSSERLILVSIAVALCLVLLLMILLPILIVSAV